MSDNDLKNTRDKIDSIDLKVLELLNRRAALAKAAAASKLAVDPSTPLYRPEREAQVLQSLKANNKGPLPNEAILSLYREIMSCCLRLELPTRVGYLGPAGTFTQEATYQHFGVSIDSVPFSLIDDVFQGVANNQIDFGVVPIENSSEGVVHNTLDSLFRYDLKICSEIELKIHQNLLVSKNTIPKKISQIYSHPMSFAQCRLWLDSNFPNTKKIPVSSNSEAAKKINSEWHSAAIGSRLAAKIYNLNILNTNIEDKLDNSTRFLVIGKIATEPTARDKTSIIVSANNESGILYKVLFPFKESNVSLSRIETRPSREHRWSYVFFIDFEGHCKDPKIEKILSDLANEDINLKVLGSYPQTL